MRKELCLMGLLVLTACGDPLAGVPRLAEVDLEAGDPAAQALPSEAEIAREGFFGTDAVLAGEGLAAAEAPRRRGLLGVFRRARPVAAKAEGVPEDVLPAASAEAAPRKGGLLGRLVGVPKPVGASAEGLAEASYGEALPFGVLARNCAARRQPLGRKVESASGGYMLYDTAPGGSGLRTFYITGFADGCPRQLTAAHVLLGAPSFYELLHYGPAGAHLAQGETDAAYETVKGRVCGVGPGRPCGGAMKRLERSTFFVNAYPRADDNTAWSEMLIHEGSVLATALKSSG